MLTEKEVSWKTKKNAKKFCKKLGYRYLDCGAFSVFFIKPEDEGKQIVGLSGTKRQKYSELNWLKVFKELNLY